MNAERLLRLADHLDAVPAEQFDMNDWGRESACGTVACAFGHACLIPEFQAAGLSPRWSPRGYMHPTLAGFTLELHGDTFETAAEFFGIRYRESNRLFDPDYYLDDHTCDARGITPAAVAARIRDLVAGGTPSTGEVIS